MHSCSSCPSLRANFWLSSFQPRIGGWLNSSTLQYQQTKNMVKLITPWATLGLICALLTFPISRGAYCSTAVFQFRNLRVLISAPLKAIQTTAKKMPPFKLDNSASNIDFEYEIYVGAVLPFFQALVQQWISGGGLVCGISSAYLRHAATAYLRPTTPHACGHSRT